jgi:PAS domain S-box-containing protein
MLTASGFWQGEAFALARIARTVPGRAVYYFRDDPFRPTFPDVSAGGAAGMNPGSDPPPPSPDLPEQHEARYRLLVESVKDYAIFMLDPTGHVLTWNVGAERIKGYTAEEIIGQHFSRFYPPEDVASGKMDRELVIAAAEGRYEEEGWRVRKDGTRFWAHVVLTALRDADRTLHGFAKVTRDLTERRRAEEQARRLAQAEAARAQAEIESRRKDEYLAMLAHELRNPLAPVRNGLTILQQAGHDPTARGRALVMMDRQVRHMQRMIDDLLDVARLTWGKLEFHPRRLDLARLVHVAVEDRRPAAEKAGVTLTVTVPPTPVWVQGDEARLAQVVTNLLNNALKFTGEGGRVDVDMAAAAEPRQAAVTIRDTGIGIPADLLPRLFQPFTQGDQTLARVRGGLGLGLAVVKGVVAQHGGRVEAHSAGPGQGAEFRVRLPVEQEPPAVTHPVDKVRPAGRRLRILVVEDFHDAAESLRMLLELMGHEVRVAFTGPEGVSQAAAWGPEVVISDIGLPGLDGYAVATQLRQHPATARARLIALTGYGTDADRQRGQASGFDHFLTKPADPQTIERALLS